MSIWSGAYGLELLLDNSTATLRLHQLAVVGIAVSAPAALWTVAALARPTRLPSPRAWGALWIVPVISIALAWTNEVHGLY